VESFDTRKKKQKESRQGESQTEKQWRTRCEA